MPIHDHAPRRSSEERVRIARERASARRLVDAIRRRLNKRRDGEAGGGEAGEGVPVDPNRPSTLGGGAAAALAFDD